MADKADEEGSLDFDTDSSSTSSNLDETGANDPETVLPIMEMEIPSALPHVSINMDSVHSDDAKLQQAHAASARIVAENSLQNFGGVFQGIVESLGTDLENGLPSDEQASTVLSLTESPEPGFFTRLLKAINDYTVWLLVLAAGLSLFFGFNGMTDGFLYGVITIAVIIVIVVQNYLELHLLQNMSGKQNPSETPRKVVVKRGGDEKEVSSSDILVAGDHIVPLEREPPVQRCKGESLELELGHCSTIDANKPFLFDGAKVTGGSGGMLVTSVGTDPTLGQLMSQVTRAPGMTPLPAELDKVNTVLHIIGLLIPILILLVLFLRLKLGDEDVKSKLPQLKGKPTPIMDAISGIFMKSNGKFCTLIATLTMSLLGVKGGIPFVISRSIDYWRKKMLSDKALAQKPLAWLTMGSVSTICIDKDAWLTLNRRAVLFGTDWTEKSKAREGLKNAGVNIILVSENSDDKVSWLESKALDSNGLVLEGENFRNYSDEERMSKVDDLTVMESCSPSDKLLLVQCLKEKSKRVAMVGGKTNEIPALKEADVGLVIESDSSEMARETSDMIIIKDGNFSLLQLVTIIKCGRCTYENIRKYIQFELAMTIAGLLIPAITTLSFGYSPISLIQMQWAIWVLTFLGGLALMREPPTEKLMDKPPLRQTEPLITKAMWRNLASQALYQTAILVLFQFKGQAIMGISKKVSESIIFNSFVLCQVFNIVNEREPEKKNVFRGIHRNPWFWVAVGVILVLQVAYIETAHILIGNGNLNWVQWFVCLLIGMTFLATDWATKWTSGCIMDWFTGPFVSHVGITINMTPSSPSESTSNVDLPLINGNSSPPLPFLVVHVERIEIFSIVAERAMNIDITALAKPCDRSEVGTLRSPKSSATATLAPSTTNLHFINITGVSVTLDCLFGPTFRSP
ncbi:calcium-transporting ATPase 9, plasma membrane-type-like [Alnus glutinosa]|uniref:calcium-transporting ATPase 9, plasma membrane-type-like n=1 Tax=Alnus glutinosa TaxID=3517 RepID=UPI002D785D75|nr:calcium-transporting ATPase 9, plasma membrane-type-like [Alnus glutinosa]